MIRLHGKNDFAERSKILLDTGPKIILLGHQNVVGILKISNAIKNFNIATSLSVLWPVFIVDSYFKIVLSNVLRC